MTRRQSTPSNHCRLSWLLLIALVALAGVAPARSASAQGTSGTLPDPITSRELLSYAARLKLSEQQIMAAQALHDQYKQEFRALREGDIAAFLKDMHELQGGGMMPKREVVETFVKKMDVLNGKIVAIDSRYFDQLQAVLTPDQQVMVSRVRQARQRTRYGASEIMMMSGNRPVDLSEILLDLELGPDQLQLADPLMGQYETKLTTSMGKLYDLSINMIIDMYDAFEKQGFTEESMTNPETAEKLGEAMQNIWRDLTQKAMDAAGDIGDLNKRTYRSVSAVLAPEAARQFRDRYYKQAYPEANFVNMNSPRFEIALKLEELTAEQREALLAAKEEYERKIDKLLDDAVAHIEENKRNFSPFDYDAEHMQEYQKKLNELTVKAGEATAGATQTIVATLGPELAQKFQTAAAVPVEDDENSQSARSRAMIAAAKAQAATSGNQLEEAEDFDVEAAAGEDQYLPPRIGQRELTEYAALMRLTEDQQAIVKQLHKDYLEKFKAVSDKEIADLKKASQSMWSYDQETMVSTGPTLEKIENTHKLREAAMEAVRRTDAAFFDEIEMAVLQTEQTASIKRVRMARERLGCNRGHNMMFSYAFGNRGDESGIDLTRLAMRQRLDDAALKSIEAVLIAYEDKATTAFRAKYDLALQMQQAQERWSAEIQKAQSEGETNPMKFAAKYQETMGEISKAVGKASADLGELNRQTIEKLVAALPADAAYTLRSQYNLKAFPNIYNDQTAIDKHLNESLKLGDLTDEQRRKLDEIAVEYRPAYAALCEQMIQATAGSEGMNFASGDPQDWQDFQKRQEVMSKLRFDRDELNTRAIGQLKTILTEDQLRRIGGVPVPKKRSPYEMWE